MYRVFFDRAPDSINGAFTIHKDGVPVTFQGLKMERLACRSGQKGYASTSWTRGKSPIPYSKQVNGGKLYLWLKPIGMGTKPGHSGIGEAYPISNTLTDRDVIYGPGGSRRELIRVHGENALPGTAGCVALVHESEYEIVFSFLKELSKTLEHIDFEVL